jgi:signal transduction histidine kinase
VEGQKAVRPRAAPRDEGRLAASIAHEINNPLDALLNLLYLIEADDTLSAKGHEYLTLAQEEVHRVSEIAHETLDKCQHRAVPEYVNVPQLIDAVVTLYKPGSNLAASRWKPAIVAAEILPFTLGSCVKFFPISC